MLTRLNGIQILRRAVPILIRSAALYFFEAGSIVALRGEAAMLGDLGDGKLRIQEQVKALFYAILNDELKERCTDHFLKVTAALFWREKDLFRNRTQRDLFCIMLFDISDYFFDSFISQSVYRGADPLCSLQN